MDGVRVGLGFEEIVGAIGLHSNSTRKQCMPWT